MVLQGTKRTRFSVMALHDGNVLCRILGLLTVRGLAPEMLSLRRHDDMQSLIFDLVDQSDHDVMVLANKVRQIVAVQSVKSETLVPLSVAPGLQEAA